VLGLVVATLATAALVPAIFGATKALLNYDAAQHVVVVARADKSLFAADQALRVERGILMVALGASNNGNLVAMVPPLRQISASNLDDGLDRLMLLGKSDSVAHLRKTLQTFDALRATTDVQIKLPKAERDPAQAATLTAAGLQLAAEMTTLEAELDNSLRQLDPEIASLIDAKRALWDARLGYGSASLRLVSAVAARQSWSMAVALEDAAQLGGAAQAWSTGKEIASVQTGAMRLAAAIAAADQGYLNGPVAQQRDLALQSMRAGKLPDLDLGALNASQGGGLALLSAAAIAAFDEAIDGATLTAQLAIRNLALQSSLLAVALGLVIFGFWVTIRRISQPIRKITQAMQHLSSHDLSVATPYMERLDEIGAMAGAVEVFKASMIRADALVESEAAAHRAQHARGERLEALVAGFENKAGAMIAGLGSASRDLTATARDMNSTADETTEKARAAGSSAEEGSAGVQAVATAAEQLSASVAEIGRQVSQSAAMAGKAVADARNADTTVRALAEAAQRIDEVVNLIAGIARQTNLLALNATIESARAGEAGRGFAVVAHEVKSLATQTGEATEAISSQIAAIQSTTRNAVTAIQEIASVIEQVSGISNAVATAIEQQGLATSEIARNVQQTAESARSVTVNIVAVGQAANQTGSAAGRVFDAAGQVDRQASSMAEEIQAFVSEVRAA